MKERQPRGPYHLAGWSFGGIVAYEMARQLRAAAAAVACVVLIDSWAPLYHVAPAADDATLLPLFLQDLRGRFGDGVGDGPAAPPPTTLADAWHQISHGRPAPGQIDRAQLEALYRDYRRCMQAMFSYRPVVCRSLPVHLIKAATPPSSFEQHPMHGDPHLGWKWIVDVRTREIDGDHYSIFAEPRVARLAHELDRCLAEAEAELAPGDETPVRAGVGS
jgi:thioesterase domain-containing protein